MIEEKTRVPNQTYYELVRADGEVLTVKFASTRSAAEQAKRMWPDQEQDPERTGKGWDIQIAGAGR